MIINNLLLTIYISPWPFLLSINIFFIIIKLINNLLFNFSFNIWLNLIIILFIITLWIINSLKENYLIGLTNKILNLSIKLTIILIIISEFIFFSTFFYNHYSIILFSNNFINIKINFYIFKLNFLLAFLNLLILLSSRISITIFTYLNFKLHLNKFFYILWTIILTIYFIFIQLFEFSIINFNSTNSIFYSNFYLLTIFHINHVIIGLILIIFYLNKIFKILFNLIIKIKLLCWYWHFVDLIWILIFFFIY